MLTTCWLTGKWNAKTGEWSEDSGSWKGTMDLQTFSLTLTNSTCVVCGCMQCGTCHHCCSRAYPEWDNPIRWQPVTSENGYFTVEYVGECQRRDSGRAIAWYRYATHG